MLFFVEVQYALDSQFCDFHFAPVFVEIWIGFDFFFFTQSDFVCVGLNLVHILVGLLVSSYYFFSL